MKKINATSTIKIFFFFIIIMIIVSLTYTSMFLYKNLYEVIANVQTIKLLKSQVSIAKIDINLYKKIIENMETKKAVDPKILLEIKNPFQMIEMIESTE